MGELDVLDAIAALTRRVSLPAGPLTVAQYLASGLAVEVPADAAAGPEVYLPAGGRLCVPAATNYCKNPGLELDSNSDGTADGCESNMATNVAGTVIRSASGPLGSHGIRSQRWQYTGLAGDAGAYHYPVLNELMTSGLAAGEVITVSFLYTLALAGCTASARLYFTGSNTWGTQISLPAAATAQPFSITSSALPAGTTGVYLIVMFQGIDVNDTFDLYVDDLFIEKSSFPTPYGDGSEAGWAWTGPANASTSVRTASGLTYRRRFSDWQQGTIAGMFVPLIGSDNAAWENLDSIVSVGRGQYGGGVNVGYWYPDFPLMAIANATISGSGYVAPPETWLSGSTNVFVATWENLDQIHIWVNGVEDLAHNPMDISVFNSESVINVGRAYDFGSGKSYVGPLIVSEEVKPSAWIASIMATGGVAFSNIDTLFDKYLVDTDVLIPLVSDTTSIVKGTKPYILPMNGEYLLLCDGNSITYGTGAIPGSTDYPHVLKGLLPGNWDVLTPKITGDSTSGLTTKATTYHDPLLARASEYEDSFVVFSEAVNSLNGSTTPAQELASYHSYCDARRAAGWGHIIVMTMTPSSDSVRNAAAIAGGFTGWEDKRTQFNALLRAGYADFADGLVDVGANAYVGNAANCNDGIYFNDTTHLTGAGLAIVAGMVKPVIEEMLPASQAEIAASAASADAKLGTPAADIAADIAAVQDAADSVLLKTNTIGALAVTVTSPVADSGTITLYSGDDYASADSRAITITVADPTHALGLDNVAAVVKLKAVQATWEATSVASTTDGYTVTFELTAAQTAAVTRAQHYELEATLANGHVVTLARGSLVTRTDIPAVPAV